MDNLIILQILGITIAIGFLVLFGLLWRAYLLKKKREKEKEEAVRQLLSPQAFEHYLKGAITPLLKIEIKILLDRENETAINFCKLCDGTKNNYIQGYLRNVINGPVLYPEVLVL